MISADTPAVTVIIPTHNRSSSLRRTLEALRAQTLPPSMIEVCVVMDACTDDTEMMLRQYAALFLVHVMTISPPNKGPACARNLGAGAARGPLLLFLDDDVVPDPHLVQAHIDAHRAHPDRAVVGPYLPVMQRSADCFRVMQQTWWHDKFTLLQRCGHRFSYTDVLSGNLSVSTRRFRDLGGFDETFPSAHEDYELGIRFIKAGLSIVVARSATARHYECEHMTIDKSFQRAQMEGRADVLIAHRHASVVQTLPFAKSYGQTALPNRIVHSLASDHPSIGDRLAIALRSLLPVLERCRFRHTFHRLYRGLRHYWYVRGVTQEAGSTAAVGELLERGRVHAHEFNREIEIDLREGLPEAESRLDQERPDALRLWYGQRFIGRIPIQPGMEPLRGHHLRPVLATTLAWPYLMALVFETAQKTHSAPPHAEPLQPFSMDVTAHASKNH